MTGNILKSIRKKHNLTQQALAERLHYSKDGGNVRIAKLEAMKRKVISPYVVSRFRLYATELLPDGEWL